MFFSRVFFFFALFGLTFGSGLEGCTGLKLIAKDGSIIHGRTVEFGTEVETSVVVIPRNYEFTGTTPNGPGLKYKVKYATVGAITFDTMAILDGINEKGLSVGTFYFPGFAGYAKITKENQSKALSPSEFPNWIITQFATVEEVKSALSGVVIAPTIEKNWGTAPAPFHYIVYDKKGDCIVIEPMDGKLVTYDNKIGTITNSPNFDWMMTNLRNFINLKPENAASVTFSGVGLTPFGQGSGMVGLPGDFSPPSRFVRAAIFSSLAIPAENGKEAIYQAFHILNNFDIPKGVISATEINGIKHTDITLCTCVRDPQNLVFYFKTYDDQAIRYVDLKKFDLNAKSIKIAKTGGQEKYTDFSKNLK